MLLLCQGDTAALKSATCRLIVDQKMDHDLVLQVRCKQRIIEYPAGSEVIIGQMYPRTLIPALAVAALLFWGCGDVPSRSPGPDWMRKAKLAGLAAYPGMSQELLEDLLDEMVDQHVDVVIGDSELSNYQTDTRFETHVKVIDRVAEAAHQRGLKLLWYIPSLEVQTVDGLNKKSTMGKDHPDWLQVGVGGKKNVFYGSQEDWVEATDESAWMCPISGYRDYFLKRIRRLAASRLDGVWVDVPVYLDTGVKWNCQCERHKAQFKKDTGVTMPAAFDCAHEDQPAGACGKLWSDPAWRRWINYRHHELNDFQLAVHKAGRAVKGDFQTVIEVFTMDYNDAMDKGLDGTFMGNVEGLTHVWEIDSVSNGQGMLRAKHDDWLAKIALAKFARGADRGRPTWVFSYGNTSWDAELVMATAFASQANPYETKTPEMATTVGGAFRKRMYSWADRHIDAIYDSRSAARVAVLYSSLSRDYVDYPYGFALYNDTEPPPVSAKDPKTSVAYQGPDKEWWSDEMRDSVRNLEVLGEYRGVIKVLSHLHLPFAVEPMQKLTAGDLARYETVMAPNLTAITDQQAQLLRDFVKAGGKLILTGLLPTGLDGLGATRSRLALADLLGFDKASMPGADGGRSRVFGKGSVHYVNALLARRYLRNNDASALRRLRSLLAATTSPGLVTDAHPHVYFDLYRLEPRAADDGGELVLHAINFVGINGNGVGPQAPQEVKLTLQLPADQQAASASASSPEAGYADRALKLTEPGPGLVQLNARISRYALIRVKLAPRNTSGQLKLQLQWPVKGPMAPSLAATVQVSGQGLASAVVRHLAWDSGEAATLTLDKLPPGEKTVEFITVDDSYGVVGRLTRTVTVQTGGSTSLTAQNGVAVDQGPAALTAYVDDLLFLVNGTAAAAKVSAGQAAATTLKAGAWTSVRMEAAGSLPFVAGSASGQVQVSVHPGSARPGALTVASVSATKGYAGHSVVFEGSGFGQLAGRVTWGGKACPVTGWNTDRVAAHLPSSATPGSAELVLLAHGRRSKPVTFTVVAPPLSQTPRMKAAFDFVKTKMRSAAGGVYTNYKDRQDPSDIDLVYPFGHHQTAEHMGLMLWVSAALADHEAFERSYRFLAARMVSPRQDVVNWAIHKTTGEPMLQREDKTSPWLNANAPLDDFRVVKGLISGWMTWRDERYLTMALRIGHGLYATSVSNKEDFPAYPGGLVAYAYNWPETIGTGLTDVQVIPIDYADLWTMRWLAGHDPRWNKVLSECTKLMETAQILTPAQAGVGAGGAFYGGQFFNSLILDTKKLSGDFEYRDTLAGQKVKSIQSLWIAIHLARTGRTRAATAALSFYRDYYKRWGRIDEYINYNGTPCAETFFDDTLRTGEVRIYSQAARLAYYMGDRAFGDQLVLQKVLRDQDTNSGSATYGSIGLTTAGLGDAEAWNTLESLIALAFQRGSPVVNHVY